MTRTPVNDFGDHYTNQLYYALFILIYLLHFPYLCLGCLGIRGLRDRYTAQGKHLIGVEPINNCFEGKRCTNSAKDVQFFIVNQSLLYLSALFFYFYKG